MDSKRRIIVDFSEEEAYELLFRCMNHDGEDSLPMQTAMTKLAEAIKGERDRAA